jgi:Uma2 family endonuclease
MTTTQNKEPQIFVAHLPMVVRMKPVMNMSDEELYQFSQINPDLRIERNAQGELIIMSPTGGETGERNAEITMQLRMWAKGDGTGATFDSSTGFRLPNGGVRSPDAAWVRRTRLDQLTAEQRSGFIPLCPDFVIELRLPSDNLAELQDKMREYIVNGAEMGWLLDTQHRRVYVYRPGEIAQEIDNAETIFGDPLLPRFQLDLREIW